MTSARPWENEPDHVEFVHAGFPCILHRNTLGAWCGYVGVPPRHPAYGKHYDDVNVTVHGGLTYANACQGAICHKVAPGENDEAWWLGFDCCHLGDLWPRDLEIAKILPSYKGSTRDGAYRDAAYVAVETKELAEQLAEMADVR